MNLRWGSFDGAMTNSSLRGFVLCAAPPLAGDAQAGPSKVRQVLGHVLAAGDPV